MTFTDLDPQNESNLLEDKLLGNVPSTLPLKPPKTSHKLPVKKNGIDYVFQALTKNVLPGKSYFSLACP